MSNPSPLSALLRSAEEEPRILDEEKIVADLRAAMKLLSSNHLSKEYSNDLVSLITHVSELVGYTSAPTYPVTTTVDLIARLQFILRNLEAYIRRAQQTYIGYAIVNQKTSKMLPNLFFNKMDAMTHLEIVAPMFDLSPLDFTVQEVIYSSVNVGQPLTAPTRRLPLPPLPDNIPPAEGPVTPEPSAPADNAAKGVVQ